MTLGGSILVGDPTGIHVKIYGSIIVVVVFTTQEPLGFNKIRYLRVKMIYNWVFKLFCGCI